MTPHVFALADVEDGSEADAAVDTEEEGALLLLLVVPGMASLNCSSCIDFSLASRARIFSSLDGPDDSRRRFRSASSCLNMIKKKVLYGSWKMFMSSTCSTSNIAAMRAETKAAKQQ